MNKEKIRKLAELIRPLEKGTGMGFFCMGAYVHLLSEEEEEKITCVAPACMAGWALEMEGINLIKFVQEGLDVHKKAQEILELDTEEAIDLFTPDESTLGVDESLPYTATGAQAARVLEHFANTGEVDWGYMHE